jgi:hypothetical protein
MSAAFGWTVEEVEQHVVALIQSGDIKGRVDSQNKVQSCIFLPIASAYCLECPGSSSQKD